MPPKRLVNERRSLRELRGDPPVRRETAPVVQRVPTARPATRVDSAPAVQRIPTSPIVREPDFQASPPQTAFDLYDLARDVSHRMWSLVEHTEGPERRELWELFERVRTEIPQPIWRAFATEHERERRALYHIAHGRTVEALGAIELLATRGRNDAPIANVRAAATALVEALAWAIVADPTRR
jgi:hypothetical protein